MDDTYIIAACLPESDDGSLRFDTTNLNAWMTGWVKEIKYRKFNENFFSFILFSRV